MLPPLFLLRTLPECFVLSLYLQGSLVSFTVHIKCHFLKQALPVLSEVIPPLFSIILLCLMSMSKLILVFSFLYYCLYLLSGRKCL